MSSLFGALKTTFSAFNTINSAIQITGDNIANANNQDYNRQIEVYEDLRFGGVKLTDIIRLADEGLRRDYLKTSTESAEDEVLRDLYEEIEQLTGAGMGHTYLSNSVQEFGDAWKAFEAAPENYAAEREVVRLGNELTNELERLSYGIDQLEVQLRQDIIDLVDDTNSLLYDIDRLNEYIVRDQSKGISTANYENNRDAALTKLAKIIDIKTFGHDNGALTVYSSEGLALVDLDEAQLSWDLNEMSLTLSGKSGNLVGTSYLPGGELGARINLMRTDVEATFDADYEMAPLQKFRNQLDELAYNFVDDSTAAATGDIPLAVDALMSEISGIESSDVFTIQASTIDDNDITTNHTIYTIPLSSDAPDGTPFTMEELVAYINNDLTIPDGEPEIRARITAHGSLEINTTAGSLALTDTAGTALADMGMISGASQSFAGTRPPYLC